MRSPAGGEIPAARRGPDLAAPGARRASVETVYRESGDNRGLLIGGALFVLIAIAAGLVLMPTGERAAPATDQVAKPAGNAVTPVVAEPRSAEVTRADAQAALQAALQRQAELEVAQAPRWAEDEWRGLLAGMTNANEAFQRGRFAHAKQLWEQAVAGFTALRERRAEFAARHLRDADAALARDQSEAARAAYESAVAADPDSEAARTGAARAARRPELLAALADGRNAEARGDQEQAADAYRRASDIDGVDPRAPDALQRISGSLASARFNAAMSRALQSLDAGRYADARAALKDAEAASPGDVAARDLRQRIDASERAASLNRLRRQADEAVAREDWATAVERYQAALKLDADTGFARDGLARAQSRLELHRQLDHYLARPDRLYGAEPLHNAKQLLKAAGNGGEPGLKAKVDKLRAAVEVAGTPLGVTLRSDGETEVAIYHVSKLGRFQELGLELTPGDYTVVGSRDGYRDVRRVIQVRPGLPLPPISIRCTEAL
ncbi:MAG: hypothetical protein H6980_00315 [Gammaproteobacteria bacterium]|nr:hypothetical protein [Gammaproteobacteria bacterium]